MKSKTKGKKETRILKRVFDIYTDCNKIGDTYVGAYILMMNSKPQDLSYLYVSEDRSIDNSIGELNTVYYALVRAQSINKWHEKDTVMIYTDSGYVENVIHKIVNNIKLYNTTTSPYDTKCDIESGLPEDLKDNKDNSKYYIERISTIIHKLISGNIKVRCIRVPRNNQYISLIDMYTRKYNLNN